MVRPSVALMLLIAVSVTLSPGVLADDTESEESVDLVLILDASNSMWGQIDGINKIVIAREAVGGLIDDLPDASEAGLVAYGHRREGDCDDIEVLAPIGPLDKTALKGTINAINPKGRTPITASINSALELVATDQQTSIVLISDGLETCGLDPCAAVRSARESGVPFVLHVIGFDVAGEDTTQLECAAQEGGGVFLSASNAPELSAALVTAYEKPVEPDGRVVVGTTADGSLQDAVVRITNSVSGENVASGRTYTSPQTNPRRLALEDGNYRATIAAVGIKGSPEFSFDFEIKEGNVVEREFDFSAGEILIGVTRNGELSDAVISVESFGDGTNVAGGRTYRADTSNPKTLRVAAGTYNVSLKSVEVKNGPEPFFENVIVKSNEKTELSYAFESGVLSVGARRGDTLVDAVINIEDSEGLDVGGGRTYTSPNSNPKETILVPGNYRVQIREVRGEPRALEAEVSGGETTEIIVDFEQP